MKKYNSLFFVLVLVFALVLTACGGVATPPPGAHPAPADVDHSIVGATAVDGAYLPLINGLATKLANLYSDVEVIIMDDNASKLKLHVDITGTYRIANCAARAAESPEVSQADAETVAAVLDDLRSDGDIHHVQFLNYKPDCTIEWPSEPFERHLFLVTIEK